MRSSGKRTTLMVALLVATACLVPLVKADALPTRGRMRKAAVIFKPGTPDQPDRAQQITTDAGGNSAVVLPDIEGFVANIPDGRLDDVTDQPDVQIAAYDTQVSAAQTNPPWGLDRIDQRSLPLSNSYNTSDTGAGVDVYVIDSGIRTTHSDFGGRASSGVDYVDGGAADDCNGHGTGVAGTIGGTTSGVAKQAHLIALRVLNCEGSGFWTDVIRAMEYVAEHHTAGTPAIANLSLGGSEFAPADTALKRLNDDGVTVVAAAGNDGDDACNVSPAAAPAAITVAASTKDDERAVYSNFGPCVDLFAPGDDILSATSSSNSDVKAFSGTSMAAAHVAGVAALYLGDHPSTSPTNLASILERNATAGVISDSESEQDGLLYSKFANPPGAPQSVSAVAGDKSATVSWSPPANDGGSPITGYRVSRSGQSGFTPVDANARSFVASGLTNGTQYTFTVRAENAIDAGPPATAQATPAVTTKPDLVVTSVGISPEHPTDGNPSRFKATIMNIGSVASPGNVEHRVLFTVDNGAATAISTAEHGPIEPGESATVEADTLWTSKLGSHTLDAFVDSPKVIDESNETNNHLTTTITVGPNDKVNARIAYGGSSSLVVWQDSRSGTQDIYGARVDANGHVLDKDGIRISTAKGDQTDPSVAWNGSSYLVVWSDGRAVGGRNIFGTLVGADGSVVSKNGVAITTAVDDQLFPAVRANGSTWLVAWQDAQSGTGTDIYGARVGSDGVRIGSPFAISKAERDQRRPSIAAGTSGWMVVWGDRRPGVEDDTVTPSNDSDIYGARVTTTGSVVNPNGIAISTAARDQSNPAIAWNGSQFLVAWSDYRSNTSLDIYGSRLSPTGTVQNPNGIAIATTAKSEAAPALSANGSNFLVAWQAQASSGATWDVLGTKVSPTGVTALGSAIAGGSNDQTLPAVGLVGANYLVVWSERRGTSIHLLASRITQAGQTLTPSGFAISPTAAK